MVNAIQLQFLRPGDRVKYQDIRWQVTDYSPYKDHNGYKTIEWQLQSEKGQEYYLLREFDPKNIGSPVHWYLAQEISHPQLFLPDATSVNVIHLQQNMQAQHSPYPTLKLLGHTYYFESQTQGKYQQDGDNSARITWDYWDQIHRNNLATETWENGELSVYLSQMVEPEDFSEIEKGVIKHSNSFPIQEAIAALFFLIIGFLILIFG